MLATSHAAPDEYADGTDRRIDGRTDALCFLLDAASVIRICKQHQIVLICEFSSNRSHSYSGT